MKRIPVLILSLFAIFCVAGCLNDGENPSTAASGNIALESRVVSKAALIDVLWNITDDPDPNAACVAKSNLNFDQNNAFSIMKSKEKTAYNTTPVSIVSTLIIQMPDAATDGRAADCGSEPLQYIVSASEIAPIDIETSESISSRLNLEAKAGYNPTIYPAGCRVVAHFEKHGDGSEEVEAVSEEPQVEEQDTGEESTEEETDDVDATVATSYKDEAIDDTDDENGEEGETAGEGEDGQADDETANAAPIYTLKLVIDEYNCNQQMTAPYPNATEPPQNWQKQSVE